MFVIVVFVTTFVVTQAFFHFGRYAGYQSRDKEVNALKIELDELRKERDNVPQ